MKITKEQLKKMIQEELNDVMSDNKTSKPQPKKQTNNK
jgi:hypothetical protein